MTEKLKHLTDSISGLITFTPDHEMSDSDLTANIRAINLLVNICDELGTDRSALRSDMDVFFAEICRRINSTDNIQNVSHLIKCLFQFIYGRSLSEDDRGPALWRRTLTEMTCRFVDSYKTKPVADSTEYLWHLLRYAIHCRDRVLFDSLTAEYSSMLKSYLPDIDRCTDSEKIRRTAARKDICGVINGDDNYAWHRIFMSVGKMNQSRLSDSDLIILQNVTGTDNLKEMRRRSTNSKEMMVEYLTSSVWKEIARAN